MITHAKLGDVAPAKPLKRIAVPPETKVWHLNLDQIESNSGQVLVEIIAPAANANNSTHWFDERHVLYSKLRPYLNKVVLPSKQGIATTELVPMMPDPERLDRGYLAHYLKSTFFVNWISRQVAGAKMPRVSMKILWDHKIPLPPMPEQKRIAAILDKADAIRRKRQKAIRLANDFLRATFLDMFGDLNKNPGRWKKVKISNLLADVSNAIRTGPFGSQLKHSEFELFGVPVIGIDNIVTNEFRWSTTRCLPPKKYQKFKRYRIFPNDIIVTIMGTIGKVAVAPSDLPECMSTKHLCVFTLNQAVADPLFIWASLLFDRTIRNQAKTLGRGAIMEGWNMSIIKNLRVRLPPIELQKTFGLITNKVLKQKSTYTISTKKADTLFQSISQRAFQGSCRANQICHHRKF